jgi:ribose transport system substrate-binding protein
MRRGALHAVALAAVVLSACGSSSPARPGGAARHVGISFVYATTALNAMQEMAMGAKAAAQQSPGVDLNEVAPSTAPNGDATEASLFRTAVGRSPGGIAYQALSTDNIVQPLQKAHAAGVPLVAVDTPPPPSTGVDTFVGNSNFEVGQMLATEMLDRIPAGAAGQVVIGTSGPSVAVLDQRVTGMVQVLRQQRPAVRIIGPFDTTLNPASNLTAWAAEVKQYPSALAYMAPSDLDAVSLAQVERETGRRLLVGACDLEAPALQAIRDGLVYALASPEHWLKGYISVKLLAAHAQSGKALPSGWWNPGALIVDHSNVEEIIARQQDEASRTKWFTSAADRQLANPGRYVKPLAAAL